MKKFAIYLSLLSLTAQALPALEIGGNHLCSEDQNKTLTSSNQSSSEIVSITNSNWTEEVENCDQPIVLDAYADWCGPCRRMSSKFNSACEKYGSTVKFAKMNVDQCKSLSNKLEVTALPTFLFIRNGRVIHKHVGSMSEQELYSKIERHFPEAQ